VDVKAIAAALGEDLSAALPAYHAFTGCDYTSSFVRRGKVKPFQLLQKQKQFISAFLHLGLSASVDEDTLLGIEHFVCGMYGRPTYKDINKLRHELFVSRYDVKTSGKTFSIPEGVDLSMLPPCRSSLQLHIKRANYVAHLWKNSHVAYPEIPAPIGFGWELSSDGVITVQWTQGDIMPQQLVDVLSSTYFTPSSTTSNTTAEMIEDEEEIEEDYDVDSIMDIMFSDDE